MQKLFIDYVEFYITHVCNLACNGCNRFNDRKLNGWQKWSDYEPIYRHWGNELDIQRATIMGGEPLLNVTLYDWLDGLTEIWPQTQIAIASNGFFLPQNKKLYYYLFTKNINLNISLHNKMHKKQILDNVENFLEHPLTYNFDNTPYRNRLTIIDNNKIKIKIEYNWWFHQGAIIQNEGYETLHTSDPLKAHKNCHSKTCHHFDKGKLYKCGPASLFPQYDEQRPLKLSPEDRQLMQSVKSLSITDSESVKKDFLGTLKDPIPQCKFCPEVYHGQEIFAEEKKNLIFSQR